MKLKKRKKSRRLRGFRLHGKSSKKHKGKGTKGGKGMAGTGKRAGQKKTFVLKRWPYFGKKGMKRKPKKLRGINVEDIEKNLENWLGKGKAKKTQAGLEVEFKNFKILGRGEVKEKLIVKASKFSNKAREKIEKARGKAIVLK